MATKIEDAMKVKRDRSPAYPFIALDVALDRLRALEAKFGRHPAPLSKAGLAWDLKPESSQAAQTLSALKYYGLVEYVGTTQDRAAAVTEEARNYLRAQQTSVKEGMLKAFALKPKAMQIYWTKWGADLPIDEMCLDDMVLKDGFTATAAKAFLRVYDDTIVFSGLQSGNKTEFAPDVPNDLAEDTGIPAIGVNMNTQKHDDGLVKSPLAGATQVRQGTKQENCVLIHGTALLQWPEVMTEEDFEDFNDWVQLVLRKIKRSIIKTPVQ